MSGLHRQSTVLCGGGEGNQEGADPDDTWSVPSEFTVGTICTFSASFKRIKNFEKFYENIFIISFYVSF